MHNSVSTKLLYLPTYQRGQGLIEIETINNSTKIMVSNYLMKSEDPRLQLVRRFEEMKVAKGLKSVLKDTANYAKGLGITITFDETKTVLTNEEQKTIEGQQASPKHISNFLTQAKKQHLHERDSRTEMALSVHDSTKQGQRNGYRCVQITTKMEKHI